MWTYGGAVACTLWNKTTNSIPLGRKTRETDHFAMTLNFLMIYIYFVYILSLSIMQLCISEVSNSF